MSIPYTDFRYFCPPRTDVKIPIKSPVKGAWARMPDAIAQYKLNGSRNMIVIDPQDNIQFWNRHGEQQRNYSVPNALKEQIRSLAYPHGYWNVFDSELMHFKTPEVKNTVYVFDTLVWKSQHLVGETYKARFGLVQPLIYDFFPLDFEKLDGKMYIAQNLRAPEWDSAWNAALKINSVEGLVLKREGAVSRLVDGATSEYNNAGFMCRIRKPFKNCQF